MPALNWIGKEAVVKHRKGVPLRLPGPPPELSCGPADAGTDSPGANRREGPEGLRRTDASNNLIVQGDNLHALKALLPRYAGQVKCSYIDPPYNTGNEGRV